MIKDKDYKLNQFKFLENMANFKVNLLKYKIPIQGIPQNFQFEIKDFYDSPHHLNTQGAKKYTKELIKILNQS